MSIKRRQAGRQRQLVDQAQAGRQAGRQPASQRQLAEAAGIQGATLTHHLNALETAGLVTRRRDPANRGVHVVALTPAGDALFPRLRDAAMAFDARPRTGLSDREISRLAELLTWLSDNVR